MTSTRDLVIVGGGSAGMAAAIAAHDAGVRDILLVERNDVLGGILNQCIHNGFGLTYFKEELTGPEFLTRFANEVKKRGIETLLGANVTGIDPDKTVHVIHSSGTQTIKAKAIIMAAGCYERSAGAIGMPGERPSGVITAGQAQLYLNQHGYLVGKKVFILGSGDIGLIMARRMTLEGAKVLGVAELMPYSNGLNRNIQQCLIDFDIPLYLSHTVTNVIGKKYLEAIELSEVDDHLVPIPGTGKIIPCDTLLLSIGLIPNNDLLDHMGIPASKTRGSEVDEHLMTAIDGVFSCGNVLHVHDLVDYVVYEGELAGKSAASYLQGKRKEHGETLLTRPGEGVGYVVPSRLDLNNLDEKFELKFRVRKPYHSVYIEYRQGEKLLKRVFKPAIIPSEMEIVSLPRDIIEAGAGDLSVTVVPKEEH